VDLVLTDPPYDKFTHAGGRFKADKSFGNVDFNCLEDLTYINGLIEKSVTWIIIFCVVEALGKIQDKYVDKYVRGMVWDRINPSPQLSGDRPAQGVEGIALLHHYRKNMKWNGGGKPGLYRCSVEFNYKEHPTQKPLKLINRLVAHFSMNANEIILDPYLGSGTTAVAAKELGRKFIGIEISETYCQIAVKRLRQGVLNFTPQEKEVYANPNSQPVRHASPPLVNPDEGDSGVRAGRTD
jgi:site-specific DNA-methyltransferase (adenine-specific)